MVHGHNEKVLLCVCVLVRVFPIKEERQKAVGIVNEANMFESVSKMVKTLKLKFVKVCETKLGYIRNVNKPNPTDSIIEVF